MTRYSTTCGDDCELRVHAICGQMLTVQCDCGPGRCFSGWDCVPDTCAELYTQEALHLQREPLRQAAVARIEQRLAALGDLPIEQEVRAAVELRDWLATAYPKVRFHLDRQYGPPAAIEASTSPRALVIEVWMYGSIEHLRFVPRSLPVFRALLAGGADPAQDGDSLRNAE